MTSAFEEVLLSTVTWLLKVVSWREAVHAVNKSGSENCLTGEHRIDLKCRMVRSLLQGDVLVGEDLTENLAALDFIIQLRGAPRMFAAMNQPTEDDDKATGALVYYPPTPAERAHDGKSEAGSVTGSAFFDNAALWEIARSLSMLAERELYLIITMRAAATPKPGQLIYEIQDDRSTTYRWSGKYELILHDVALQNRPAEKRGERVAEPEKPLAVQISEAIERSVEVLKGNISHMGVYVLILLGAILITLWHVR